MTDVPDIPDIQSAYYDEDAGFSSQDSAAAPPAETRQSSSSYLEQEEGVLADVLNELDRERQKRAEMEAQVRVLQEELHSQRRKNSKSTKTSVRDYTQILAERDGYKEILDALTADRPALNAKNNIEEISSLPIHIVRLLEVMPWDPRVQQYIFGIEQVYEFQIYGADKKWKKELRQFPTFFKTLPIVVPTPGKTVTEASRNPFAGMLAPPKQCVLTNLEITSILNINKGYPLPEDGGGWKWVGPWRVEKNTHTDEQGWMYSNDAHVKTDPKTYHNEFQLPAKGQPNMMKRRRKWTRLRVLVDYPYASNMTREYLKMLAEKATLDVSVDKLSGQLVETKMVVTSMETDHFSYKERTDSLIKQLENEVKAQSKLLGLARKGASGMDAVAGVGGSTRSLGSSGSDFNENKKIDQYRSAVTQWVSEKVEKVQHKQRGLSIDEEAAPGTLAISETENGDSHNDDDNGDDAKANGAPGTGFFDILKKKGGEELDKLKQKTEAEVDKFKKQNPGGIKVPWHRKDDSSGSVGEDLASATENGASNTAIHGTVSKLETLESENTAASSDSAE
ncbi:MAG: hypothetical protein SGARI_000721 [Bacillariaceae sp.]